MDEEESKARKNLPKLTAGRTENRFDLQQLLQSCPFIQYRCSKLMGLLRVGARKCQQDRKEAIAKMPNQKASETRELAAHCPETKDLVGVSVGH